MISEHHPFPPFLPPGAKILFLGSFPPPACRWSMPFYYPNWINDFWRIMGLIHYGDRDHFCILPEKRFDEEAIRSFCANARLAFYDTACEVRRLKDNASDAFLEIVTPTDLPHLLAQIPECDTLVTTGQKASEVVAEFLGCRAPQVGNCIEAVINPVLLKSSSSRNIRFWRMPSTSRAYPLPIEKKAEYYKRLF